MHFEKSILQRFKAALSSAMPGNEEGIGIGGDKLVVKEKFRYFRRNCNNAMAAL